MTICYLCTCATALSQEFDFEGLSNLVKAIDGISDVIVTNDLCHSYDEVADSAIVCACSQNYLKPLFRSKEIQPAFVDLAFLGGCDAEREEKQAAALALICGAIQKLKSSKPVPRLKVPLTEKCIVIGGGISALTIAFHLSKFGFGVTIVSDKPVEDSDFVQVVPNHEEATQELSSLSKYVQETCEIIDNAQSAELKGRIGSFTLSTVESKEVKGSLVVLAGDYEELPHQEINDPRIMTWKTFRENDAPKDAAIVICQCYGSRDEPNRSFCSSYCCETAVIEGKTLKQSGNNDVTIVHQDIRTMGLAELAYRDARESGVKFIRGSFSSVQKNEGQTLSINVENTLTQTLDDLQADQLILSSALLPPSFPMAIAESFGLSKNPESGFLNPLYSKLRKESTTIPGVYVTETLLAPATYEDLVDSAKATALRVVKNILTGYEKTEPRAIINPDLCTGCETCYRLCPAKAITMKYVEEGDKMVAHVDDVACLGCGICSSACPTRAIEVDNYGKEESLGVINTIVQKFIELQEKKPVLLYQCKECALASADLAQMTDWNPKLVLPIVVPCAGHISLLELLKAFQSGADGIVVSSCTHCHNGPGDQMAEAYAEVASQILDILGQNGERISHLRTCAAEPNKLTMAINDLYERLGR